MIAYPFDTPPAPGKAVTVAPGVLWMRLPLPMALDHVNVYALEDGDGWTLVDTGFDTPACRDLWDTLLVGPLADPAMMAALGLEPAGAAITLPGRLSGGARAGIARCPACP